MNRTSVKRALITGASSGIGEAFARTLAARGTDLVVVARRVERLEALRDALEAAHGVTVEVLAADLIAPEGLARTEARLAAGDIDLLVNNAGFGAPGQFSAQDLDQLERVVRLNVVALMRLTHAALGPMCARGSGDIVQVASLAAFQPSPSFAVYAASKAFVLSFSEAVHEEVRARGVGVLTVCPGFTRTEFQDANAADAEFLPEALWSQPHHVVDAALDRLGSRAVVVPRWHDWVSTQLTSLMPRLWVRRIASWVGGQV